MPVRSYVLGKRHLGKTLAFALNDLAGLRGPDIAHFLKNRWVRLDGALCQRPQQRVRPGQKLQVVMPRQRNSSRSSQPSDAARGADIPIVHLDEHIVVVNKPAGLTTVRHAEETAEFGRRAQRFLPATLVDLLQQQVPGGGRLRAVHRLDKETSGLVVLARTAAAERHLGKQFRAHSTERVYLALVRGAARDQRIETDLVRDRGDGRRGSGAAEAGQRAVTLVRVVQPLGPCTLVECRLETGRTHQVRIHLGEAGTPLCGERIYDRPLHGAPYPEPTDASRPMLHAAVLAVEHPATGRRLRWECALPQDMQDLVERLTKEP